MRTGTVKSFDTQKGFGFIAPDDGGRDVFVHLRTIEKSGIASLGEGQRVAFATVRDRYFGKLSAKHVRAS